MCKEQPRKLDPTTARILSENEAIGSPKVFINYRNPDVYAATALDYQLVRLFGRAAIFRAAESIPPGANFEEVILAGVARSKAMLVLIGPSWAESLSRGENEWTTREIKTGQAREEHLPMIPVLLDGATMPAEKDFPQGVDPQLLYPEARHYRSASIQEDALAIVSLLQGITPNLVDVR